MRRLSGLISLCLLATVPLHGAVVITDLNDTPVFQGNPSPTVFNLDINLDGTFDLTFRAFDSYFEVLASASTEVAGFLNPPPDLGSKAFNFDPGYAFNDTLEEGMSWNDGRSMLQASALIGNSVVSLGYWGNGINYLGVRLLQEDGWHYAYVEIDTPFTGFNGGFLKEIAYETTADTALVAAVPEPSTFTVSIAALFSGVGWVRFRRLFRRAIRY